MKTKFALIVFALVLGLVGLMPTGQAAAAVEIKVAHVNAKTHPVGVGLELFKTEVEKASKGAIKVKVFHSAALGGAGDIIQGVQLGNIQMGTTTCGAMIPFCPEFDIMSLPFVFRDEAQLHKAMDGELGKTLGAAAQKRWGLPSWVSPPAASARLNRARKS